MKCLFVEFSIENYFDKYSFVPKLSESKKNINIGIVHSEEKKKTISTKYITLCVAIRNILTE